MQLVKLNKIGYLALIVSLFIACQSEPDNISDFSQYITKPSNGYLKERNAGPFIFSVLHFPPKLMALKEVAIDRPSYDSIYQTYQHSLNFQFTIAPNSEKAVGDVTRSSIHTIEQYDQRLRSLNFHLNDYWSLETLSGTFHPVLSQLEQTGGLTDYRRIQLAFTSPDSSHIIQKPWTLTFRDDIWGTGINRWRWE